MNELLAGGTTIRSGPCILIVEDEFLVAEMLEQMLDDLGYNSVKVGRLPQAIDLAATTALRRRDPRSEPCRGGGYPVADELHRRGIPFVFSTGSGPEGVRGDYRGWPTLSKPYREEDLQRILAAAFHRVRSKAEWLAASGNVSPVPDLIPGCPVLPPCCPLFSPGRA